MLLSPLMKKEHRLALLVAVLLPLPATAKPLAPSIFCDSYTDAHKVVDPIPFGQQHYVQLLVLDLNGDGFDDFVGVEVDVAPTTMRDFRSSPSSRIDVFIGNLHQVIICPFGRMSPVEVPTKIRAGRSPGRRSPDG